MSTFNVHSKPPVGAALAFLLAEKVIHLSEISQILFWEWPFGSIFEGEAVLPALAAAVGRDPGSNLLYSLAAYPLPDVLSPEALPWHGALVRKWERHWQAPNGLRRSLALLTLVRLDSCGLTGGRPRPSRLAEWLAEAKKMENGKWKMENEKWKLAAVASWRPAPGVVTDEKTLHDWVRFWMDIRQSGDAVDRGFAALALLNLTDGGLPPSFRLPPGCHVSPAHLLPELAEGMEALVNRAETLPGPPLFPGWQPAAPARFPPPLLTEVARSWLKATHSSSFQMGNSAWRQLLRWEKAGILTACGIDLLPHLLDGVNNHFSFLRGMLLAQWQPAPGTTPDPTLFRQLKDRWALSRRLDWWGARAVGWQARIILQPFHALSRSDPDFKKALLKKVATERDDDVLFVLSRYLPDAMSSANFRQKWQQVWQSRLTDEGGNGSFRISLVAEFALYAQALTEALSNPHSLRRLSFFHWQQGYPAGSWIDISHVRTVQKALAAGVVPDFVPDASADRGKRLAPVSLPSGHLDNERWRVDEPLAADRRQDGPGMLSDGCENTAPPAASHRQSLAPDVS